MNNMNMGSVRNNLIYIVLLIGLGIFLFATFSRNRETVPMMDIGQVAQQARDGKVKRIAVDGEELTVTMTDDKKVRSRKEETGSLVETLQNLGVAESAFGTGTNQIQIVVVAPSFWNNILPLAASILPVLFLAGFFIFLMRQAQGRQIRRSLSARAGRGCSPATSPP